ncbi:hypothetical protein FOCG_01009 [Fusarium oxysporum f. sp. radicis-lycopersici 26381]|uniref:Uncharacterized protein n=2 Tax=Fusarium oxysporum TaxID=5507 RepID=W9J209_FUSOX|nr:hypothetical protein FOYG_03170 [Fusarium oxysporum NRRL 32931]EWZ44965.1 hypothetical protein FOZG_05509 [Fusarium oxysporum Fo47]EWZ98155.1 hypothetical protein FOWG_02373 [Fusarium oxysporum f. sp. lycopersici MN25]EXL62292.1 hypothetical protein FOCG_01009 [Fusarium oxysporum f. sp. radicis-lycopersici 26381]
MELLIADRGALLQTMHVGRLFLHLRYARSDYSISSIISINSLIHVQPPRWAIYPLWQKGRARHGQSMYCMYRSTAMFAATVEAGSRNRRRGSRAIGVCTVL